MTLVARTDKTIVDHEELAHELNKTKERQFAIADEEYLTGLVAIGAALYDPISGQGVGAVSFDFSVLQHSAKEIIATYGGLIRETAKTISELLPPNKKRR